MRNDCICRLVRRQLPAAPPAVQNVCDNVLAETAKLDPDTSTKHFTDWHKIGILCYICRCRNVPREVAVALHDTAISSNFKKYYCSCCSGTDRKVGRRHTRVKRLHVWAFWGSAYENFFLWTKTFETSKYIALKEIFPPKKKSNTFERQEKEGKFQRPMQRELMLAELNCNH